jgi:DNA topoisomerase-2
MEYLKLTKKVSELYTVMDQNNKVQTFDNINDIFWAYFQVKMEFLAKRKVHLIESITQDIKLMISKYTFIKGIIDDTIVITKRPTEDIIRNLENTPRILKVDDSFDYLLNMSIRMMTEERTAKLVQQIKNAKVQLDFTKSATPEMMWLEDLN